MLISIDNLPAYDRIVLDTNIVPEKLRDRLAVLEKGQQAFVVYTSELERAFMFGLVEQLRLGGRTVTPLPASPTVLDQLWKREGVKQTETRRVEDASVYTRKFHDIVNRALDEGASDIHIEVRERETRVRFDIFGEVEEIDRMQSEFANAMCRVLYMSMADQNTTEELFLSSRPQSAKVNVILNGRQCMLRVQTAPASPAGFDMVIRVLPMDQDAKARALVDLGYYPQQAERTLAAVHKPVGVVIVAGVTGSGKSTTLKNMILGELEQAEGRTKVVTVEDPPEYIIPGATQIPVESMRGAIDESQVDDVDAEAYVKVMRAALRMAPKTIVIGEVRDHRAARLLVAAVQSGHRVMTTVHATSSIGILPRLADLSLTYGTLGTLDFISALIYQKLMPVVCPHCSSTQGPDPKGQSGMTNVVRTWAQRQGINPELRWRNPQGCPKCRKGLTGRMVVPEVLVPDKHAKRLIGEGRIFDLEQYWLTHLGGMRIAEVALRRCIEGKVTLADVVHYMDADDLREVLMGPALASAS